jgi:hypothetical protein
MNLMNHYVFVDESGDPGKPFAVDSVGNQIPTGASRYYILAAVCLTPKQLNALEHRMMEVKSKFGYKKEIKSNEVSLALYKELLSILNELEISTYYRMVDKHNYHGQFAISGNKKLHNVFDEYNLVKVVAAATRECALVGAEVIIDRTERRLLEGKFDNFNEYLKSKTNTKTIQRVKHVTHVSSDYVNAMQMSDLICGAIKENATGRNTDLIDVVKSNLLVRVL